MEQQTKSNYFKGLSKRDYIEKAYEIIQNEGIAAVSIRRIAKEMGCYSASMYRYFGNLTELLFYAELRELQGYIKRLNASEKRWKNVWDIYVGVWDCYAREAFQKPEAYDLLFFKYSNMKLQKVFKEYYEMFPEDIEDANHIFAEMLYAPSFVGRDFRMCRRCIRANAINYYEAIQLNRVVCMTYKGYLKTILDDGIREEQIEGRVREFISDVDMIVMKLAKDLKGYNGYYSTKKNI